MQNNVRIQYQELRSWAEKCLVTAGAETKMARVMAESLLAGDLLGFRTHGIRRLPYNVKQLVTGNAKATGTPTVVKSRAAVAHWDAEHLPGLYVMPQAVSAAIDMAQTCGTGTLVVRRMEHVASLAAYLEQATAQGLLINIVVSTPAQASVAPFGATSRVFSPNPYALGVPTSSAPLLLDMSLSVTAAGKVRQAYDHEELLPWEALVTAQGEGTNDPASYFGEAPRSALLPLGGLDLGYKGYGLCLMSEIWTMALSNYGRVQGASDGECNTAFIQVMDPEAFGSSEQFLHVTDDLLQRCREATPIDDSAPVRIPGERAAALKAEQLALGVSISGLTWQKLQRCGERLKIAPPQSVTEE
ncbi:lactate dehydrogenase [Aliidiomarina taiwanensis]|uniref:Lactate dehydrogenase n=1 Tax=Aliidiomarina taiwanensis TaxID=946228 RepID=A0A432WZ21_9GAMM|nr:Ldh family oxidoreductase [Aliidiomarina taiwanensis]RUO39054.1 lactate dehydrogenase [Aliidiomarina taiwanensis]